MKPQPSTARAIRAKLNLISSSQYEIWEKKELPKLLGKYPKFNYTRLVDISTDKNYIFYRTR